MGLASKQILQYFEVMIRSIQLSTISTLLLLIKHGQGYTVRLKNACLCPLQRPSMLGATPGADELREQAAQLRREIQDYETSKSSDPIEQQSSMDLPHRLADSVWQLTYRFNVLGEKDRNDDNNRETTRESYGGTVTVKFLADGYTELISQRGSGSPSALISKAWGWDLEVSPEDQKEYLLFSMDFRLPDGKRDQRCYFQALHHQSPTVELSEGTVTLKQDVVQKASQWALFSPAGILAQFKFAGNFVAKPVG